MRAILVSELLERNYEALPRVPNLTVAKTEMNSAKRGCICTTEFSNA